MKKIFIYIVLFLLNFNSMSQDIVSVKEVFNAINKYDTTTVQNYFLNGGDIDAQYTRRVSISQKKSKKISTNLFDEAIVLITKANESKNQDLMIAAYRNFDILLSKLNESKNKQEILDKTFSLSISTSDIELVRRLSQMGANINHKCELCYGRTPILIALGYNKDIELIKFLLSLKPDLNLFDNDGKGCLHYAAMKGNVELFEYLVENTNIDINTVDGIGFSPLFYAVMFQNIEVYNYLIHKKANTKIESKNGKTILHMAAGLGDIDFFKHVYYTSELPLWSDKASNIDPYRYAFNEDIQIFIKRNTMISKGEKYVKKKLRANFFKHFYLYE